MQENRIAFITAVNNAKQYKKCCEYLHKLHIPKYMATEYIDVADAKSITEAYNFALTQTKAKYKIYLHQDTYITDRWFLYDLINYFREHEEIGICGVVGCVELPDSAIWWKGQKVGKICDNVSDGTTFNSSIYTPEFLYVEALDGLLLCTQYDLPWRTDLFKGWHFYDLSQCQEFINAGYRCGIIDTDKFIIHDCGESNMFDWENDRQIFIREYLNGKSK